VAEGLRQGLPDAHQPYSAGGHGESKPTPPRTVTFHDGAEEEEPGTR